MADLIREGKILHWGISETTEEYLRRAHRVCPVTAIQNRFSMMARWHEPLLPIVEELGIGFVAHSPLANGLLTNRYTAGTSFDPATDYRASMPQYRPESFEKNRALFSLLEQLADGHRATASQISLAWMMNKRPAIVPIPGTRHLCRLKENIGAADIHLTDEEVKAIDTALDAMEMRIQDTEHRFYREMLINAMQTAILDFYDFHARIYGESDISTQNASIMNRFLKMLEEGAYREHREVTYYADCLCVTSKYLSEVSKKVSGYAANYWINRYTILDITRLLRNKSLAFVQISDMFGFSSPAYFSRYVQQNLGVKPSDYRE